MRVLGNGDAGICHASLLAAGNTHVTSPSLASRCHYAGEILTLSHHYRLQAAHM